MTATISTVRGNCARWATAPLVAAIAAGAVCAGVGVGSAATTSTDLGAETSGPYDMWVSNATDKPIDVIAYKKKGHREVGGIIAFDLAPNAQKYGEMNDDTVSNYTTMSVCYNNTLYVGDWETTGHKWNDLYVFAHHTRSGDDVFVTGTGGGDNRPLEAWKTDCHPTS